MNSKRLTKLFSSSENLSRNDIDRYKETLDEKVKHTIEEKSLSSDFDADALEGWSTSTIGTQQMKNLDQKFLKNHFLTMVFLASGIALVIIASIFFFTTSKTESIKTASHPSSTATNQVAYEKTDIVIPEEIEEMKELPKKQQISIATIQKDYAKQQKVKEENPTEIPTKTPEKIEVDKLPVKPIEEPSPVEEKIAKKEIYAKEVYLEDLKLVDYRNYRSKPAVKTEQLVLEGTPASMEDKTSKVDEPVWKNVDVPYIEYIDKTMATFARGNYKKALSRFETILKTYPDDINANFYGGLCYYNLGEHDKAISTFNKCLLSEFINFNEEAEWYLAKSYLANGEKEKAISLFKKINNEKGYYAKQAEKFL